MQNWMALLALFSLLPLSEAAGNRTNTVMWGKPVDGLQVGLSVANLTYEQDAEVLLTITFRNVLDQELRFLTFQGPRLWCTTRIDATNATFRYDSVPDEEALPAPRVVELAPGQSWMSEVLLNTHLTRHLHQSKPGQVPFGHDLGTFAISTTFLGGGYHRAAWRKPVTSGTMMITIEATEPQQQPERDRLKPAR